MTNSTTSTVREQVRGTLEGMLLEHDNEPDDQQGLAFLAAVDALTRLIEGAEQPQVEFERDWFEDALREIADPTCLDSTYNPRAFAAWAAWSAVRKEGN